MNKLLAEGLTDAVGFLAGVAVATAITALAGLDILSGAGYDRGSVAGIVLVGLGGGVGVHLARRWRAARMKAK